MPQILKIKDELLQTVLKNLTQRGGLRNESAPCPSIAGGDCEFAPTRFRLMNVRNPFVNIARLLEQHLLERNMQQSFVTGSA